MSVQLNDSVKVANTTEKEAGEEGDGGVSRSVRLALFTVVTVVVIVGFIGNGLVIYMAFACKKFRVLSTSVYLSALAFSDILQVFTGTFTLNVLASDLWIGFNLRAYSLGACVACEFIIYTVSKISSWCVVAITLERLFVILKPHK